MNFKPHSGLGTTAQQTGGTTWAFCHSIPASAAVLIGACREAFANDAATLYQQGMYGGQPAPAKPPGPVVSSGDDLADAQRNLELYRAAQQARIRELEAQGYTTDPVYAGLTAEDLANDLQNLKTLAFDVTPWLIAGGLVVAVLLLDRR